MVNGAVRHILYRMSQSVYGPAQINFFHVCKEVCIKASDFFKNRIADCQAGSACPENLSCLVVLLCVGFYRIKYASLAKRNTIFIDVSSGSAGIFESSFFAVTEYF